MTFGTRLAAAILIAASVVETGAAWSNDQGDGDGETQSDGPDGHGDQGDGESNGDGA